MWTNTVGKQVPSPRQPKTNPNTAVQVYSRRTTVENTLTFSIQTKVGQKKRGRKEQTTRCNCRYRVSISKRKWGELYKRVLSSRCNVMPALIFRVEPEPSFC